MASAKKNDDFNAWVQMEAMKSQNVPLPVGAQLFSQSTPVPIGGMSLPPDQQQIDPEIGGMSLPPEEPPPPPRPVPVQAVNPRKTAQPTTDPIGTTPAELVPGIMGPRPQKLSMAEEVELAYGNLGAGQALQQDEISRMKERLAQYSSESRGIDFTPLAAMLDSMYGGKLTDAAKAVAPESAAQKQKNLYEMQKQIADAQGKMTAEEREAMKERLAQLGYEQQRKTALDIARINAASRLSGIAQEKLIEAKAARVDKEIQALEKRVGDMPPSIAAKMRELDTIMPGGIGGDEKSGDIPGVGPGQMLLPDFLLSDEGSAVQNAARGLMADLIFLRSGAAATDVEVNRRMKEYGLSASSKESTFRTGLKRLKKEIVAQLKNKEAGFRPEVKEGYKLRGGITHEDIDSIGTMAPDGGGDDLGANLEGMSDEELKAWIKKHGGQ